MDNLKCCHFVATGQFPGAKVQHFQGFLTFRVLFKFDRCRGFAGAVVEDAVDVLDKVSVRIVNEVKGINRIVYDISSKPPATIAWE